MKTLRHLHLVGATGKLRTAEFNEIPHIVVPVTAMVEGVVWAINSDYPEFVAAEELAISPQQWDGRPAFAGHPEDDGIKVTANTPRTLEKSFGLIFNTVSTQRILKTKKLEFEVWLDPAKAELVGAAAQSVCNRLLAGKPVEVSVGAYVVSEEGEGEYNGKPYLASWTDIVSDHIAFLAEDEVGACSIDAGCGALRTSAIRHLITAEGIRREDLMANRKPPVSAGGVKPVPPEPPAKRSLTDQFHAILSALRDSEGMSDSDLRYKLNDSLRAIEPGYLWIENVYPDDGMVIYCVNPAEEYVTLRRSYTLASDGAVTLAEASEKVEPKTTYVPITAAEGKPCPCGGHGARASETNPTNSQGETMKTRAERIAALVANPHNPLKDAKGLEASSDDALKALETHCENAATLKAAADAQAEEQRVKDEAAAEADKKQKKEEADRLAATAGNPAAPKPQTTEEWLKTAPPEIRDMHARETLRISTRKTELVGILKAASTVLTEEQLKAKSLDDLEMLAKFAKVEPEVDHSLQAPRVATSNPTQDFTPPNPYEKGLKTLRGEKTVN